MCSAIADLSDEVAEFKGDVKVLLDRSDRSSGGGAAAEQPGSSYGVAHQAAPPPRDDEEDEWWRAVPGAPCDWKTSLIDLRRQRSLSVQSSPVTFSWHYEAFGRVFPAHQS